jgi:hypothetical protein
MSRSTKDQVKETAKDQVKESVSKLVLPKDRQKDSTVEDLFVASNSSQPAEAPHVELEGDKGEQEGLNEDDEALVGDFELHPTIINFLVSKDYFSDGFISDQERRKTLALFPALEAFPARPPQPERAFANSAKDATLKKDKSLALLTVQQLQAIRPLLYVWNDLLEETDRSPRQVRFMESIQASIILSLHSISSLSQLRRRWILQDVNPSLASSLSNPSKPLFGTTYIDRLETLDSTTRALNKLNINRGQQQQRNYNGNNSRNYSRGYNNNGNNGYRGYNNNNNNHSFRSQRNQNFRNQNFRNQAGPSLNRQSNQPANSTQV